MYSESPDFKEKLRKSVVLGERILNGVFVVVILQGSCRESPQAAHTMNSSFHFPGRGGQAGPAGGSSPPWASSDHSSGPLHPEGALGQHRGEADTGGCFL